MVSIVATAKKVDMSGDCGYMLELSNKSQAPLWFFSKDGWSIKGSAVEAPVLYAKLAPGETTQEFMWFDHEQLSKSSLSRLVSVKGSIAVMGASSPAQYVSYAFDMQ